MCAGAGAIDDDADAAACARRARERGADRYSDTCVDAGAVDDGADAAAAELAAINSQLDNGDTRCKRGADFELDGWFDAVTGIDIGGNRDACAVSLG